MHFSLTFNERKKSLFDAVLEIFYSHADTITHLIPFNRR